MPGFSYHAYDAIKFSSSNYRSVERANDNDDVLIRARDFALVSRLFLWTGPTLSFVYPTGQ